jgi:hypothetical protein
MNTPIITIYLGLLLFALGSMFHALINKQYMVGLAGLLLTTGNLILFNTQ